jgi:hypothetical protein
MQKQKKDIFLKVEWIILRIALILLLLIGIFKVLKVELSGLW